MLVGCRFICIRPESCLRSSMNGCRSPGYDKRRVVASAFRTQQKKLGFHRCHRRRIFFVSVTAIGNRSIHATYWVCKCFYNLFQSFSTAVDAAALLTHSPSQRNVLGNRSSISALRVLSHSLRWTLIVCVSQLTNKRRIHKKHKLICPRRQGIDSAALSTFHLMFFGLFIQPFHHLLVLLLSSVFFLSFSWQRHLPFNFFSFSAAFGFYNREDVFG